MGNCCSDDATSTGNSNDSQQQHQHEPINDGHTNQQQEALTQEKKQEDEEEKSLADQEQKKKQQDEEKAEQQKREEEEKNAEIERKKKEEDEKKALEEEETRRKELQEEREREENEQKVAEEERKQKERDEEMKKAEQEEEKRKELEAAEKKKKEEEEQAKKAAEEELEEKKKKEEQEAEAERKRQSEIVLPAEVQKQIDEYAAKIEALQNKAFDDPDPQVLITNVRDKKKCSQCQTNPSISAVNKISGQETKSYDENIRYIITSGSNSSAVGKKRQQQQQQQTREFGAEIRGIILFAFPPRLSSPKSDEKEKDAEYKKTKDEERLNASSFFSMILVGCKITETSCKPGAYELRLETPLPSPADTSLTKVELSFPSEDSMIRFEKAVEEASIGELFDSLSEETRDQMEEKYGRSVFVKRSY